MPWATLRLNIFRVRWSIEKRSERVLVRRPSWVGSSGLAAVDHEGVSDGERSFVGAEERDRSGDLFRPDHAANRYLTQAEREAITSALEKVIEVHHAEMDLRR